MSMVETSLFQTRSPLLRSTKMIEPAAYVFLMFEEVTECLARAFPASSDRLPSAFGADTKSSEIETGDGRARDL